MENQGRMLKTESLTILNFSLEKSDGVGINWISTNVYGGGALVSRLTFQKEISLTSSHWRERPVCRKRLYVGGCVSGIEGARMGAKRRQWQRKELKGSELSIAIAWLSNDEERGAIQSGTAIPLMGCNLSREHQESRNHVRPK